MPLEPDDTRESEAIETAAANWLAEMADETGPFRAAAFEAWRRADVRHAAAVARLEETGAILAKMPALSEARRSQCLALISAAPIRRQRRGLYWTVAGMAASLAMAVVGWRVWSQPHERVQDSLQVYSTPQGGYKRVNLADGSVIELNSGSQVRVHYSAAARQVMLVDGVAQFSVAKNPARPFIVQAREVSVRAVGTAFEVRMESSAVEVVVTEGRVQVGAEGGQSHLLKPSSASLASSESLQAPCFVSAGEHVVVPTLGNSSAPAVEKISVAAIGPNSLALPPPRLVFDNTPLVDVVGQFNRVNRVQLTLGDAELAARPVGGSFQADNVETFVRLLEGSGDIVVERPRPDRIVLHRAR